jgi:RNA polymerase-binding protein DksA
MDPKEQAAYRSRLLSLRVRLIQEVEATEEAIREDILAPGEHVAAPTHPGDQDAEGLHEKLAIAQNEEHMLEDVEAALARMEKGLFGVCENCGRRIAKQRLDAIPYTPWCIDCARLLEDEPASAH